MAPLAQSANALAIYLTQWLKTASGGRVQLAQQGTFGQKFYVFKCTACKDNWHVGAENFTDDTHVPEVLIDWVKKHRHVCQKYTNTHGVTMGTCSMCGWPYGAHEQSWASPEGVVQNWGATSFWSGLDKHGTIPNSPTKEKPLPTYKGRKFRDKERHAG